MYRFFKKCIVYLITVGIIQFGLLGISLADNQESVCTLLKIEGPSISTSCKQFIFAEEVIITDSSGRPLMISEVPLPSDADIEYLCESKKDCNRIIQIRLHRRIKALPE